MQTEFEGYVKTTMECAPSMWCCLSCGMPFTYPEEAYDINNSRVQALITVSRAMRLALADPNLPNTQWNSTKTSLFNPKLISLIGAKMEEPEAAEEEEEQEVGEIGLWMPKGSQFDVGKFIWKMIQRVRAGNVTMGNQGDNGDIASAFTALIKVFENSTNRTRTNQFNQQKESERVVMLCQVSIFFISWSYIFY